MVTLTVRASYYWVLFQYKNCIFTVMMTSSNGNIFHVTGHLCGEFTGPGEFPAQRPVTRSFDVFFDLCLNKRLSKQSWGWWFETQSGSLWRQCNGHHNEHQGISNHWQLNCLFKFCFWLISKKTWKPVLLAFCEGNPPVTGGFPSQRFSNMESISMWSCHHEVCGFTLSQWKSHTGKTWSS